MPEKSGADILVEALCDLGVEVVFGYPGGAVLPIYDALFRSGRIRHILVRHEQAATHAAEGYARSTGKPGVVLVTSGPGATNAVTGITDALMDSIPMVVLTGQVPTALIGTDAFQEADTVGITRHCTKHNYLVKDPARLGAIVHEAFYIATSGRPGPVVVDIPKDVQVATARYTKPLKIEHKTYRPQVKADPRAIEAVVDMLAAAERPVLYTGGGIINSGPAASQLLRELVRITGAPVTSTLMGLGAYPASGPAWLGMLGMHGTYEANHAMNQADLVIAIGSRFDDRVTGRLDGVQPQQPQGAHRHRPVVDQQDRARRPRRRRRLRPRAGGHGAGVEGAPASQARPRRLVCADRPLAGEEVPRLPRGRPRHHAAAGDPRPVRRDARAVADHHDRGRPAPNVGRAAFRIRSAQ